MTQWRASVQIGDVFHNDDLSLKAKAMTIRARMLRHDRLKPTGELFDLLDQLVDAGEADDLEGFNSVWDEIYDWADTCKVWINTTKMEVEK